jgi:hypothetical protein
MRANKSLYLISQNSSVRALNIARDVQSVSTGYTEHNLLFECHLWETWLEMDVSKRDIMQRHTQTIDPMLLP